MWDEGVIIGESFIWIHFPKCAGTTTTFVLLDNFATDTSIAFDEVGGGEPIWHDSVTERQRRINASLVDRDVLANIRRLPAYIVSKIHYTESLNPDIRHTKEHLLTGQFMESNGLDNSADNLLRHYQARKVGHWIRTEHLKEDFVSVFGRYLDLAGKDLSALTEKTNSTDYARDLGKWYSRREMARLYDTNPLWAKLERRVYGNLLYEEMY
ncbi:MAG: hypothetical protein V7742_00530 [Halioglobus sp.]